MFPCFFELVFFTIIDKQMFVSGQSSTGDLSLLRSNTRYIDQKKNSVPTALLHPFSRSRTTPNTQFFCASSDGRIQYSLNSDSLRVSFDRGGTWTANLTVTEINIPLGVTGMTCSRDGSLLVIDNAGYILSRDFGQTFASRIAITNYSRSRIRDDGTITGVVNNPGLRVYFDVLTNSFVDTDLGPFLNDYAVSEDNKYVYVADNTSAYSVNPITGLNTPIFLSPTTGIDCSYDGRYVYLHTSGGVSLSTDFGVSFSTIGSNISSSPRIKCTRDGFSAILTGGINSSYRSFTNYGASTNTAVLASGFTVVSTFLNDDGTFCGITTSDSGVFIYDFGLDFEASGFSSSLMVAKNINGTGESTISTLRVPNRLDASNVVVDRTINIRKDNRPIPAMGPVAIQIGSTDSGVDSATPLAVDFGATRSNVVGSNPKIRVYNNGTQQWGLGASTGGLDYILQGNFSHLFTANSTTLLAANVAGSFFSVPITAPGNGNVNITPTGAGNLNVNLSSGNLRVQLADWNRFEAIGNVGAASFNIQLPISSSGFMLQSWNGYLASNATPIRNNASKRMWRYYVDQRTTSDYLSFDAFDGSGFTEYMRMDPLTNSGRVQFGQGIQTGSINMGSSTSSLNSQKLRLYDDGVNRYGFGIQSSTLSYEAPNAVDSHIFYTGNVERIRANSAALRLSGIPITTASGDLTLNPSGANISVSTKTITNVLGVTTTNALSSLQAPKIQLYDAGVGRYGFGIQNSTLSYETAVAADSHIFYTGNVERIRVNNIAFRVAVPITTNSGDLTLNPQGSNINFSDKIALNMRSQSLSSSMTDSLWTGTINVNAIKTGNSVTVRLSGSVTRGGTSTTSFTSSIAPLTSGYIPTNTNSGVVYNQGGEVLIASVFNNGVMNITKVGSVAFAAAYNINFTNEVCITYIV